MPSGGKRCARGQASGDFFWQGGAGRFRLARRDLPEANGRPPASGHVPEVTEEALQVVGVAQLGLALVRALSQAAPRLVQLRALFLQVLGRLGVGLDQALGGLPQGVDLREQGGQKAREGAALCRVKSRAARGQNVPRPATSHLVTESREVPLKALVFALQGLDAGQIVAVVVGVQSLILLFNPLFGLVRISVGRSTDGEDCWAQRLPPKAPRSKEPTFAPSLRLY